MTNSRKIKNLIRVMPLFVVVATLVALFIYLKVSNKATVLVASKTSSSLLGFDENLTDRNVGNEKGTGGEVINEEWASSHKGDEGKAPQIEALGGFGKGIGRNDKMDSGQLASESSAKAGSVKQMSATENLPFKVEATALYSDGDVLTTKVSVKSISSDGLLQVQVGNPEMLIDENNFIFTQVANGQNKEFVSNVRINGAGTYDVDYGIILKNNGKTETLYFKKSFVVSDLGGAYNVR